MSGEVVAVGAVAVAGVEAVRRLLTDIVWRWGSDKRNEEQQRRHRDDRHRLIMLRAERRGDRELPPSPPTVEGSAITTDVPAVTEGDPTAG
jgi:hypothetical protein